MCVCVCVCVCVMVMTVGTHTPARARTCMHMYTLAHFTHSWVYIIELSNCGKAA